MLSSALSAFFLPFYHLPTRPTVHSVASNVFRRVSVPGMVRFGVVEVRFRVLETRAGHKNWCANNR